MQYTPEQQAALEPRGVSVVLSAGAGCGKTFVLTERFLGQLDPEGRGPRPGVLSRLVAITFTQRAAREMRQRIRRHSRQRAEEADTEEARQRWQHLLHQLHTARISTIDSFCVALLRRWPVEARLDPRFRVADEFESQVMRHKVMEDVLRELLEQQDATLLLAARLKGLGWVRSTLEQMLDKAPYVDFGSLLTNQDVAASPPDLEPHPWFPQELLEAAAGLWQHWRTQLLSLFRNHHEQLFREHDPEQLRQRMEGAEIGGQVGQQNRQWWLQLLPQLSQADEKELPRIVRQLLEHSDFRGQWHNDPQGDLRERIKQFKDALKQLLACVPDEASLWDEAQLTTAMIHLAGLTFRRYQEHKRQQGVVDFADLLAFSVRLLRENEHVRRQESNQIELLLVDEFQDTNPLQVELIRLLLDGEIASGRLFLVGDYKQSIYRFRHAVPEQFLEVRQEIPSPGRLPLSRNFRSRPQVLRFVNALFDGAFAQEYEPLQPHKQEVPPECNVEFLWALNPEAEARRSATEARAEEAELIARRIAGMLQQREPLVYEERDGQVGSRPVEPGDIAILFRALSDLALYEAALQRYGIPYYVVRGKAFFAQQEIYDLAHLLRALLWPEDEVALLGVLRSPIFGIRDDVLVALGRPLAQNFYQAHWPEALPEDQLQGLQHALRTLQALHQAKDRLSVSQLILQALDRTGYEATLLADYLGQRKLANLHKLLDMARAADATGTMTLADFVYQLESLVAQEPDEPSAALHPEAHGSVKLMSIHQSKGLEFPVVVVADCNRKELSSRASFLFGEPFGPAVKTYSSSSKEKKPAGVFAALEREEQKQREQESLRLFYVATTRAADYLILSAGFKGEELKTESSWLRLLASRFDLAEGACRVERHAPLQVRVVDQLPQPQTRQHGPAVLDPQELFPQARQLQTPPPPQQQQFWSPVPPDGQAVVEFSFSRLDEPLKGLLGLEVEHAADPLAQEEEMDPLPAEVGQLVHEVLARWDFAGKEEDHQQRNRLLSQVAALRGLEEPQVLQQAEEVLQAFFSSPLPEQLRQARWLRREEEFLLGWPLQGEPRLLFRGFIDCLFEDAHGRWHLVDFKTSTGQKISLDELARRYKPQLWLYAQAVEQVWGREPEVVQVWFLRHGQAREFSGLSREAPQWCQLIDQAVEQVRHTITSGTPA